MSCSMLALNPPMLRSVESLKPRYAVSMRPSTLGVEVGMRRPNRGGFGRWKASATYDTEGTIANNSGAGVNLVDSHNYNGEPEPQRTYPADISDKQTKGFRQLVDNFNTSSGGLEYQAKGEGDKEVNVIVAWKCSPNEKRVYSEIKDTQADIDWNTIEIKLNNQKDSFITTNLGLTSSMKWKYGLAPYIDVQFKK